MSYLRRPSYYKKFQCIASACTDSCCQGWEIDIDDDTLADYQSVGGAFGERLMSNIALPEAGMDEPAHFIQTDQERCPFLNACNLCDIILTLGEKHISRICTHHPRFYDWLIDGEEAGLGLCCEAAAALILEPTGYPEFELLTTDFPCEVGDDAAFERELEEMLISMREELFRILKPETSNIPQNQKLSTLYDHALCLQERYDRFLFPEFYEDEDRDETRFANPASDQQSSKIDWDNLFWNEQFLRRLLSFYEELEINDAQWYEMLQLMKEHLSHLLAERPAFRSFYADKLYEYEQLAIYFIYRYLLKAREDDNVFEKVIFTLLSVSMIELMDIHVWCATGHLDAKQQIDVCKLYSKEIEYDEDNMLRVSMYLTGR